MQGAYISEVFTLNKVKSWELLSATLKEREMEVKAVREPGYDGELDDKMLKGSYRRQR